MLRLAAPCALWQCRVPMRDSSPPACPVCTSSDATRRYRLTEFDILRCSGCRLVYLWPQMTDEAVREMFTRLYQEGEGSVPELKSYYGFTYDDHPENPLVQLYESWLDELERHCKPGRMLDIGCGTGLFLAVAQRRGWEPYGVDDCREATDHARSHFGLDVWDGTFTDFVGGQEPFDAITMWDIIEHSRDPVGLLELARAELSPGGVVGISTPNQRSILDVVAGLGYRATLGALKAPLEKFYIEQHFLYFTPESLADALRRAGLSPIQTRRELTDLRRLTLAWPMRITLQALLALASMTGLENRIFTVARAADASSSAA